MNIYNRIYQLVLRAASYLIPWPIPTIISGENIYQELSLKLRHHKNILIVTDKQLLSIGLLDKLFNTLNEAGITYFIYSDTVMNPTIKNVEDALRIYRKNNCDGIIAFGGGSPMDCAKAVGASFVRPKKLIKNMAGLLKIRKKLPTLYAIPTTAGTGSEVSIAAVITDEMSHKKYAIMDTSLVPKYAVLDPTLTLKLPPHITATTGMDALTHAIEAYIGQSNTKETRIDALKAIKLVYENIFNAYQNPNNLKARENMLYASFYGGLAFRRAYVGNVHAIAHTLGGLYSTPHGFANAIILPYVLRYYKNAVDKDLSYIATHLGMSKENNTNNENSNILISWIENINKKMNIPQHIKEIKNDDISLMVRRAYSEANPLYPVPVIFKKSDFEQIYLQVKGK